MNKTYPNFNSVETLPSRYSEVCNGDGDGNGNGNG